MNETYFLVVSTEDLQFPGKNSKRLPSLLRYQRLSDSHMALARVFNSYIKEKTKEDSTLVAEVKPVDGFDPEFRIYMSSLNAMMEFLREFYPKTVENIFPFKIPIDRFFEIKEWLKDISEEDYSFGTLFHSDTPLLIFTDEDAALQYKLKFG